MSSFDKSQTRKKTTKKKRTTNEEDEEKVTRSDHRPAFARPRGCSGYEAASSLETTYFGD
jgi:hypothetical protein